VRTALAYYFQLVRCTAAGRFERRDVIHR
jgi:hypothetical protein